MTHAIDGSSRHTLTTRSLALVGTILILGLAGCDDGGTGQGNDTGVDTTGTDGMVTPDGEDVGLDAMGCENTCPAEGERMCSDDGRTVLDCADANDDGCYEWIDLLTCGAGTMCEAGTCGVPMCDNEECTADGAKQCGDNNDVQTCTDTDGDGCLEWGDGVPCDGTEICSNGACGETCSNECTAAGAKQCNEQGQVETCSDANGDGCFEWGSPIDCAANLTCSNGMCSETCTNECTAAGAKQCDVGGNVVTCGDYNGDGCFEWGSAVPCEDPLVCSNGACATDCSDACSFIGEKQCVAGTGDQFQTCDDYNEDGCLEWGTAQACTSGLVCSGGNCAATCSDECTDGSLQCAGNATELCGDYNGDGCYEWGTAVPCAAFEECVSGACEQQPAPEVILISEILINSAGSPDTEAFIELYGPANTDLSGYSIVAVNGNGGGEYATIPLSGSTGSDGLFLVAHPSATGTTATEADMTDSAADLQNGPDSVHVRYGSIVVDALAYGSFGAGDVADGEGTPAEAPGLDESLTRDENFSDTDDNATDFRILTEPTPGTASGPPNQAPVAVLDCPTDATVDVAMNVDASSSSDDVAITNYSFDFGDGSMPVAGASAQAGHTYTSSGSYTITLTVTDGGGLTATDTCMVDVNDGQGPSVVFIKPIDGKQVTQGEDVDILVDANAASGRSVTDVEFVIDGNVESTDTSAPYEFTYTVPASAPTDSYIDIQARANDDAGSTGVSETRQLHVWNDPPEASFIATVSGALEVTVDASSVSDTETATADLEVRWDFQNDGTWDTTWSTNKLETHTYPMEDTYTIAMEVRDANGQVTATTRDVTLSLLQNVSGTVTTTTWAGTIVITGDTHVPAGETLTISDGTSVLFTNIDQDGDGVGDYDITVDGTLVVNGTQSDPVVFTVYGSGAKSPGDWNRIILNGTGNSLSHAIIEYADTGLDINGEVTLDNVEVRFSTTCVEVRAGANATWNTGTIRDCETDGVRQYDGSFDGTDVDVHDNGRSGVHVTDGTMTFTQGSVYNNGLVGFEYVGGGSGLVSENLITNNDYEGVRIATDGSSDPAPTFNYNNIYGNAAVGARVIDSSFRLEAASTGSSYNDPVDGPWSTPSGETIDLVDTDYDEYDFSASIEGEVRENSGSGAVLYVTASDRVRWTDVSSGGASSIVARVDDSSSSYYGTMVIDGAAYDQAGAVSEVSVITNTATVDLKHNYWGRFPDVLTVATLGRPASADIQGFVGVAFDSTWSKGPYKGGETITANTTWSQTIYITGDLSVSAGTTLTIAQGTTIEFAPIDQDADGVGDYLIDVAGSLVVNGASLSPVRFTTHGSARAPADWERVRINGASSDISHAIFEYGDVGLELVAGTHVLANVTVQEAATWGLWAHGSGGTTITDLLADNNGRGVHIDGAGNVSIDGLTSQNSTGEGVRFDGVPGTTSLTNATVSNNGDAGIVIVDSDPDVSQSTVNSNSLGVRIEGTSTGTLTASNIKFNQHEGVLLLSVAGSNPNPTVTGNNIFGNSVTESGVLADPALSAASTGSSYNDPVDGPWSAPAGQEILFVRTNYDEYDFSASIEGEVREDSGSGQVLAVYGSDSADRFVTLPADVTAIVARVDDSSSSYYGTMSVNGAFYYDTATNKELVALTDAGTVDCTNNYWGVFPDVQQRLTLSRTDAIDFQGFQASEIAGTGPQ